MKLTRTDLYKVIDPVPEIDREGLPQRDMRARWTGELREPKRGEWYLSGAVIEAYQAKNDLTSKYHIAEIVHHGQEDFNP